MRPHHIKSPLQYTGLRATLSAGAAAPALHRLADLGSQRSRFRPPPAAESRLALRKFLCCQASKGSPELRLLRKSQSSLQGDLQGAARTICVPRDALRSESDEHSLSAGCGEHIRQRLLALGLSLVMTLSPALSAFSPAAAQQLPAIQHTATSLTQ